jgi:hypothetical protein
MKTGWISCSLVLCTALGCGDSSSADKSKAATAQQALPPAPPPPPQDKTIKTGDDVEKAQVGVGEKGRGYGGGIITEPIRARFRAEDSINFAAMEKTISLFKATKGRMPKSHEEFMTEIIEKGAIKLPDLPDGDEYVYDPQAGELMVRHNQ